MRVPTVGSMTKVDRRKVGRVTDKMPRRNKVMLTEAGHMVMTGTGVVLPTGTPAMPVPSCP